MDKHNFIKTLEKSLIVILNQTKNRKAENMKSYVSESERNMPP